MQEYFMKNEGEAYERLRNPNIFKVTHASTERYKKSTIIQM